MTDPVCPISATPNKNDCNACILSDCNNCSKNCLDQNECSTVFNVVSNPLVPNITQSSSLNTSSISSFPGNNFICNVRPYQNGDDEYLINGNFQKLDEDDELNVTLNNYDVDGSNINLNIYNAVLNDKDPLISTSVLDNIKFKKNFEIKTANESFVLLQDTYRDNFKRYKEFADQHDTVPSLDVDFYSMRNLDPESLARNLFLNIKNIYTLNNLDITADSSDHALKVQALNEIKNEINRNRVIIDDLKNLNHTNKRQIEINVNKSRRMDNTNKILFIVMCVVFVMILFPILKKAKVISLGAALGCWCIVLLVLLGYMIYELYYKNRNRDALDFHRLNFVKPTDDQIARSRALATISDKDKARCQAYAEMEQELDNPVINLDVSQYYSNEALEEDRCNHIE